MSLKWYEIEMSIPPLVTEGLKQEGGTQGYGLILIRTKCNLLHSAKEKELQKAREELHEASVF